jgi:hypothetical protein
MFGIAAELDTDRDGRMRDRNGQTINCICACGNCTTMSAPSLPDTRSDAHPYEACLSALAKPRAIYIDDRQDEPARKSLATLVARFLSAACL